MKAITTRYIGQTERRPARLIARDLDGNRLIVPYDGDDLGPTAQEARHSAAARALCRKMNWSGALVSGAVSGGYVHVFNPAGDLLDQIAAVIAGDEHGEIQSCADAVQDIGQILREWRS
jgi:hypothetical protein